MNLRIVHGNEGMLSRSTSLGTQLTHTIDLSFDASGALVAGTLKPARELVFPVPLPPGVGGVTVPYPSRSFDIGDDAIRGVAEQARSIAARTGITEVGTQADSPYVSVVRHGNSTLELIPGAPIDPAHAKAFGNLPARPVGTDSVSIARLGASLRRLI